MELKQKLQVLVNGQTVQESPKTYKGSVVIFKTPNEISVTVSNGIRVSYDGKQVVHAEVQENMKKKVCGICGNFDDDSMLDWIVGDSKVCNIEYPVGTSVRL